MRDTNTVIVLWVAIVLVLGTGACIAINPNLAQPVLDFLVAAGGRRRCAGGRHGCQRGRPGRVRRLRDRVSEIVRTPLIPSQAPTSSLCRAPAPITDRLSSSVRTLGSSTASAASIAVGGCTTDGADDEGDGREYRGEADRGERVDCDADPDAEYEDDGHHRQDDDSLSVAHSVLLRLHSTDGPGSKHEWPIRP